MPVSKQQLEGATCFRIFLPKTPTVDFDFSDRLQLPNRRTKLLTPSVAFAGVQTLVNHNDRVQHYACMNSASIHYFSFSTGIFMAVDIVPLERQERLQKGAKPSNMEGPPRLFVAGA